MSTGVDVYSTTPGSNGTIGGTGYFPEGQAPSTVNDAARQVMADVAAWYGQAKQNLALTGVAGTNTITATGAASIAAYATNQIFTLIPAATNTGAITLNITPSGGAALGAKNVFNKGAACSGGELVIAVPILVLYDGTQFNIVSQDARVPGLVKLASGSASGATLDIVMTSYTAYTNKMLVFHLLPATDGVSLNLRLSTNGGSSYDAGATDYGWEASVGGATTTVNDTAISISSSGLIGSSAEEGIDATINFYNMGSSAIWNRVSWDATYVDNAAGQVVRNPHGGGARKATQDTDAIRLLFSAGNITSGTWTLYGFN